MAAVAESWAVLHEIPKRVGTVTTSSLGAGSMARLLLEARRGSGHCRSKRGRGGETSSRASDLFGGPSYLKARICALLESVRERRGSCARCTELVTPLPCSSRLRERLAVSACWRGLCATALSLHRNRGVGLDRRLLRAIDFGRRGGRNSRCRWLGPAGDALWMTHACPIRNHAHGNARGTASRWAGIELCGAGACVEGRACRDLPLERNGLDHAIREGVGMPRSWGRGCSAIRCAHRSCSGVSGWNVC